MKEPDIGGLATHDGPESCAVVREGGGEALTGVRMGTDIEPRKQDSGAPTLFLEAEGNMSRGRYRESLDSPARSKTRSTCATFLRENREVPTSPAADGATGRVGKAKRRTPAMHDEGKSDSPVVPTKSPNKVGQPTAEAVEGRGLAKGNASEQNAPRTQCRTCVPSALDRVRQAAKRNKGMRFTALLHHVDAQRLREAYESLKRDAAPGVDGVTWQQYGEQLDGNLHELHARLHRGAYRARATRRVYIPKADGRQRPLGIAALEDKIVQRAVVEVMNAMYEADFLGFSYGFRPGRSQHNALDALAVAITCKKVSWVLDADIRGYFDAIDHEWLVKMVEHRIADRRVVRLIQKWLAAGVVEEGRWMKSERGSIFCSTTLLYFSTRFAISVFASSLPMTTETLFVSDYKGLACSSD